MGQHVFFVTPQAAFVSHNTDAQVVAIKSFERGYYPIYTRATPEDLNHGKWSPEVLESAIQASMFGWDTPAARPAIKAIEKLEADPEYKYEQYGGYW